MPLLELDDLTMRYRVRGGWARAVDRLDLTVEDGETVGLVGESGCGKSTTARLITRLLEPTAGRIRYRGDDITHLPERRLRPYRREVQLIFQDPFSSLNPRHRAGRIVGTALPAADPGRVRELFALVGLDPASADRYPHEFSGGQRQRIGIARALAVQPRLIVADEPVSALDVSVQAQVLNLLDRLRAELGISFVFIAHDLAVVRHFCDRIAVMYLGRVVEQAPRDLLYSAPRHPYTQALMSAIPGAPSRIRLTGEVPSATEPPPSGCRFRTRCWKAQEVCAREEPALTEKAPGQLVACHFPEVTV